jgi:hypothetical protein
MNYEIIGPFTHEYFCDNKIIDKIADTNQCAEIFKECVDFYQEIMKIRFEKDSIQKYTREQIDDQKKKFLEIEKKVFGGRILTSTISKNVPKKGIQISNKIIPFGDYRLFRDKPSRKLLESHPVLSNIFSSSLNSIYNFLKKGELEIILNEPFQDSGKKWKSKITFDIDHGGDVFAIYFGDPFYSAFGPNEYSVFLLK